MLDQPVLDAIADGLVEQGVRVTYDSINDALRELNRREAGTPKGKSERDLQKPFADWKRRRRYRPYLSQVDLPDSMDKAITTFVTRALVIGREHGDFTGSSQEGFPAPDLEPVNGISHLFADHSAVMQAQMATLANDVRLMREQVASSLREQGAGAPRTDLRSEERRRGVAAATGRFFWDRMMRSFVQAIRKRGPMEASELLETLDEDAVAMAKAVFEEVSVAVVRAKVEDRVLKGKYFRRTDDGSYDLLRKHAPRRRKAG